MRLIFFLYQWLVAIPLLVVATIITAVTTSLGCLIGLGSWAGYYPPHIWSRLWCYLMFVKVEVTGRENIDKNLPYIFVCNHQGAYDIFSIYGFLNHKFNWMMKKSLEKIPFIGMACRSAGHVMVDHSSAAAIKHTMQNAETLLTNHTSLVVFPEGARSWDGKMRNFKRGAFILSKEFQLPVVPITIDGSFKVLPRFSYNIHPGTIKITIHKPIPAPLSDSDLSSVILESFNAIQSSLPDCDKGITSGRKR